MPKCLRLWKGFVAIDLEGEGGPGTSG